MMNGGYLVPANAKKGTLIFNLFREFDLMLLCIGIGISTLLLAIVPNTKFIFTVLFCMPGLVAGFLVFPIPYYHNVLCAIQSMLRFYNSPKEYRWKGWCFNERFTRDEKSKK